MSIRRRRRKLTTLLGRMEQRVRSVELRPINLLTSSEVATAVEIGAPATSPETVVGAAAPYQFKKVHDAYIYPKALTGLSEDRVEIYTEADTGAAVNDRIEVSGIHYGSSEPIDVTSDNFTLKNIDEPNWSGRPSYKHDPTQDQLTGVTISHAYEFKPETAAPQTWSTRRRLQSRRKVDSFEISAAPNSTVTLTMNATHHFEVGDIIFVDIFSESSAAYGSDGLFEITAVTGTTIEYVLAAGVDVAVSSTDVSTADVYVFPVVREWAQDGSIWVDSSNNETYYWDGIRWVDYTPSTSVGQDGDPPAPPTGLNITSTAALFGSNYQAYATVTLSWTAPTLTADGSTLTDLAGYKVRWRRSTLEDWREKQILDPTATSYTLDDDVLLSQNTLYYFELYAFDSGQQLSTSATGSHTTAQSANDHTVYPPTAPTLTSRLGTITVAWDGNLTTGLASVAAPESIQFMNVYLSTSSGFTPSSSNFHEKVRVFGTDGGFTVLTDLTYGTSYYVKITVIDSAGVESSASAQATAQVQPLVDADIVNSTLSNWPFNGGVVPAGALASGAINASNLFGNDVIVQSAIAANAIGANEIAAGSIVAGKIGANAVTAATIAAGSISADKISTNAVTADKINAGAITAVKIAADAITADKIDAGAITADAIAAQAITAAKLESDLTLSNLIKTGDAGTARIEIRGKDHPNPGIVSFDGGGGTSFRFYSNGVSYLDSVIADDVSGGTFTGGTFRTSSGTNGRVNISSSATYGVTGAVNFETYGTYLRGQSTPYFNTTVALGNYASGTATVNTAYIHRLDGSIRNTSTVSDSRLKDQIKDLALGLDLINSLRPVKFVWKQDHKNQENWGFIAQEGREALESYGVDLNNNPVAGIDSSRPVDGENGKEPSFTFKDYKLVPVLVQAVKDLSEKIDELTEKIEYLQSKESK